MSILPQSLQKLISEFEKLPGIGPKTAQRLSFYLLKQKQEDLDFFGRALLDLKKNIVLCSQCQNLAESNPCFICNDQRRDHSLICVVEQPHDVIALEQTHEYKGLYHVLYGAISPINNIGPENLKIKELLTRLQENSEIKEIILATNPNLEGEATAMYISKLIKPQGYKITRIARGLPTGADLEYADEITLTNALKGRKEY
ncbi:MAG: recombination mediator RecR [Patescibacteria group bacterium]